MESLSGISHLYIECNMKWREADCVALCKTGVNRVNCFRNLLCYVNFYVVLNYVCLHHFAMEQLSEVIRAEAETCILDYENKYSYVTFVLDDY